VVIYIAAIEMWKMVKRRMGIWSGARRTIRREDAEARAGVGGLDRAVVGSEKV